jgi:aspartate kinase
MRIFKFGGASIKDANAVIHLKKILLEQDKDLVVITSAIGKTTNKLERIWEHFINDEKDLAIEKIHQILKFHENIFFHLNLDSNSKFTSHFNSTSSELIHFINDSQIKDSAFCYDQIVSYGELWSTIILSYYIRQEGIDNIWLDARKIIKTSGHFQEARVNWGKSKREILKSINNKLRIYISQGFIGSTDDNKTTTLGREGSDYSAAVFAWALDASEVVIWKDVVGLLNADPKLFDNTIQLNKISYKEAIELSYLGASVIHPKTIKPLQNKEIPLTIRSFKNMESDGSTIHINGENDSDVPSYIFKPNQILLSISTKDYSFIFEDHLSDLFHLFSENGLKVHLMQNSALSFSICGHIKQPLVPKLIKALSKKYLVKYNEKVDLLTVRHYQKFDLPNLVANQEILIQQRSRSTIRYVLRKSN